jgi:hypothetical protein
VLLVDIFSLSISRTATTSPFFGFVIAVPLKSETTPEIAKIVENYIVKIFGPPSEISSDNAANLTGPAMKKLCAFYNIKYRNTVPNFYKNP